MYCANSCGTSITRLSIVGHLVGALEPLISMPNAASVLSRLGNMVALQRQLASSPNPS